MTVSSAGVIDGTAVTGNVNMGSYLATDDITFDGAARFSSAGFDGRNVYLTALDGNINLVEVKAHVDAVLAAHNDIVGTTVVASNGLVDLDAGDNILSSQVTAGTAATLTAGLGIDGSNVIARGGDVTMTAVQMANTLVTAEAGDVIFIADDLYNMTVTSAGVIDGTAVVGNVNMGSYLATGDITFDAAARFSSADFDGRNV